MEKPSHQELKKRFGNAIPDQEVPIYEVSSLPKSSETFKFHLLGVVRGFDAWTKTSVVGAIVGIYVIVKLISGATEDTIYVTDGVYNYVSPHMPEIRYLACEEAKILKDDFTLPGTPVSPFHRSPLDQPLVSITAGTYTSNVSVQSIGPIKFFPKNTA